MTTDEKYIVAFRMPLFPDREVECPPCTKEQAQATATNARKEGYLKVKVLRVS